MNLISIVIPIYNGAKYIPDLINCIKRQTYSNFEAIFVDDFSTDDSFALLEKFAKEDNRVILLKMPVKGGTSIKGQEYGLNFCKGEYYFFLSQDDFMDDDCLEKCINKSIGTGADVVMPNMVLYYEGKENKKALAYPIDNNYASFLSPEKAFELSLNWQVHGFVLRKMELVKKVGTKADYYNSCEYYTRKSFLYSNKIAFADTNFYYRQDNDGAITKTLKWFTIEVMTTDLMLLELGIKNKLPISCIRQRIRDIKANYFSWFKLLKDGTFNVTFEQYEYMKLLLRGAYCQLIGYSVKYREFSSFFRLVRKII